MLMLSDEWVDFWGETYCRLNKQYDVYAVHGLSFERFMQCPQKNKRWIAIYFANPALFLNRPAAKGGAIGLPVFLRDARQILAGSLLLQGLVDDVPLHRPLLMQQHRACALMTVTQDYFTQEQMDQQVDEAEVVMVHDGRYVQSMKHYEPTAKYKSRGGVRLYDHYPVGDGWHQLCGNDLAIDVSFFYMSTGGNGGYE